MHNIIVVLILAVALVLAYEAFAWVRAHRGKLEAEADHARSLAQSVEDHCEATVAQIKAQTQQLVDHIRRSREAETPPAPAADETAKTEEPPAAPAPTPPADSIAAPSAPTNSAAPKSTVIT